MKNKSILDYMSKSSKSHKPFPSSSPSSKEPLIDELREKEPPITPTPLHKESGEESHFVHSQSEEDLVLLPHDPGKRKPIMSYPVNDRDVVIRGFIDKKPCRPRPSRELPKTLQGTKKRSFKLQWYDRYDWLEYSEQNDAAYCFYCYLFKGNVRTSDCAPFVEGGFRNWKKAIEKFDIHVGGIGSVHNEAREKYYHFINQKTSIMEKVEKVSSDVKTLYKARLIHSLQCLRFLLKQGLAFRGHNESKTSNNKGNFLELLEWLAGRCENVAKVVLTNAPGNHQLTSNKIQKDLIKCCAKETTRLIVEDLDNDLFAILADESSDVSHKEQLAICLRYVTKKGVVCERFLGVVKVDDTTSMTLMAAIEDVLDDYSLSMSNIRGQGYDGASNMRGELNGLKKLVTSKSPSAYYVHCFAHQLQLTLVAVARGNCDCAKFFQYFGIVFNVIGSSCKRMEMIRVVQAQRLVEALELGEIESGKGLNQELGLSRPGDTRWGSHFKSILNLIALYPTIVEVLEKIGKEAKCSDDRAKAQIAFDHLESFEFIFMLHLMKVIFGYTNDLCQALQRRDQDIVNAMTIVKLTKDILQNIRDHGWDNFIDSVRDFCVKYKIEVPNMNDVYAPPGRSRRFLDKVTNLHRYRVEMFLSVIDLQVQELNDRFDETSMELLICMACLSPVNNFASFEKQKLLRLAEFYPKEFLSVDIMRLDFQLDIFVGDMRSDPRFHNLKGLGELSMMLVETNKHLAYPLVYLLLKLVLILPVATASVERVFSSMTFVKNKLRNKLGDKLLNHCLVTFIERDFFLQVSDDDIINRYQNMKSRRIVLD